MAWTTMANRATGDLITESDWDAHYNNLLYLLNPNAVSVTYTKGSDYTTTATTFANVDATNITLSITTNGGLIQVGAMCLAGSSSTTVPAQFDIAFNGTRIGDSTNGLISGLGATPSPTTLIYYYEPAAGTYTVTLQWRMQGAGTATIKGAFPVYLWAIEG